jgi:hypothetical protein
MLRQHPQVFMPTREVHFFNKDDRYRRGMGWYEQFFRGAGPTQVVGEKTPNYLWTNGMPPATDATTTHRRIARLLPDVKLIAVLRDPVPRTLSAYKHHAARGRLPPDAPVDEALFGAHAARAQRHGILSMGRYDEQLADYRKVFDTDQLLVLLFERDVVAAPHEGLRRACSFVGVDADAFQPQEPDAPRHQHGMSKARAHLHYALSLPLPLTWPLDLLFDPWTPTPSDDVVARLRRHYAPHVGRLQHRLDVDLAAWWDTGAADR